MKNIKSNVGSFATAKLQAKMRSILAIILLVAAIGFSMAACSDPDGGNGGGGTGSGTSGDGGTGGTGGTSGGDSTGGGDEGNTSLNSWYVYKDESSTAKETHSIASDGVCTVTIGGTPEVHENGVYNAWKIAADYAYTGNEGKCYEYKFEAWTQSGARNLRLQYYTDNDELVYLYDEISITATRTTYTVKGQVLPKSGNFLLRFQLADQLGTVNIKILEIKEY